MASASSSSSSHSVSPLKWLIETAWDSSMVFRLEKTVTIKVWQIGDLVLQTVVLAVVVTLHTVLHEEGHEDLPLFLIIQPLELLCESWIHY